MSTNLERQTNKEFMKKGKTRIQSLKDRIDIAFETLRNIYDESKLEKISQKSKEPKQRPSGTKTIQYDLEEVANKIVNKEGDVNLKTLNIKLKDNPEEGESGGQEAINDIEVVSPFVRRMQFIINELNQLKTNSNIDETELDREVDSLPNRGLIELSLSKTKLYREEEIRKKAEQEKNDYIKKLENEIVKQRISLEEIKKAENEHLLKISAYEDQIRVLKSKVFGYDISKKYEFFKEQQNSNSNQNAHIQDENLAFSMWEKENYGERKAPSSLNKLENEKQMWISNAQNNINKLENDVNLANAYKAGRNFSMNNDEDNGLWTKTPEEARIRNKNNGFNNYGNKYNRNYQGENNIGNMRRIAPMIMNNKNNY
jgi:hypothetical protein